MPRRVQRSGAPDLLLVAVSICLPRPLERTEALKAVNET